MVNSCPIGTANTYLADLGALGVPFVLDPSVQAAGDAFAVAAAATLNPTAPAPTLFKTLAKQYAQLVLAQAQLAAGGNGSAAQLLQTCNLYNL